MSLYNIYHNHCYLTYFIPPQSLRLQTRAAKFARIHTTDTTYYILNRPLYQDAIPDQGYILAFSNTQYSPHINQKRIIRYVAIYVKLPTKNKPKTLTWALSTAAITQVSVQLQSMASTNKLNKLCISSILSIPSSPVFRFCFQILLRYYAKYLLCVCI